MSWPLNRILPARGGVRPIMLLSVVVFPAPFLPKRQTDSACLTSKEIPKSIWLVP
jgi:hypothetical protein